MEGKKLARELVLGGVALIVVFGVPLFPLVATCVVLEIGSVRSGSLWAFARLAYLLSVIVVAVAAWWLSNAKLAWAFLAMLVGAVCAVLMVNW